jgi:hypothetical protein
MGRPCLFYPLTVKAIFIYGLWRPIYGASYYKEGRTALPSQGVRWLGGCSGLCGIVGWGFESPGSHLFCDNIAIIHARSKVFCTCAGCNVLCVGWVRPTRQSYVWARLALVCGGTHMTGGTHMVDSWLTGMVGPICQMSVGWIWRDTHVNWLGHGRTHMSVAWNPHRCHLSKNDSQTMTCRQSWWCGCPVIELLVIMILLEKLWPFRLVVISYK